MDFDFKIPSAIPQDLLLIQDLVGTLQPLATASAHVPDSLDSSDDSIASSDDDDDVESEDEVEADLAPHDGDSEASVDSSDSGTHSDPDTSSSSDGEHVRDAPERKRRADDVEGEESGVTVASAYLQTKNEIVETNVMVPAISEVEPCDSLEKVGEIMNIIGNVVIVRGVSAGHVNKLSERALDVESLLVFEDRKVLGYIHETFGPTSQPFYQVKFNEKFPLDTDKVWLSREVFHVPQRSYFVFVDQLKQLRGSDASNIHDEEPADDEIEFSDDEKEAAFRAERKKRRGRSASFSRQSTPAPSRIYSDDVDRTYLSSNPYDAHGPYDDDYHATRPSRPPPVSYDDPYADVPASDIRVFSMETNDEPGRKPICESGEVGPKASRGRSPRRGTRGRGNQSRQVWRRDLFRNSVARQPSPATSRTAECMTGFGQFADTIAPHSFSEQTTNAWFSPEGNSIQNYQQTFIQPHINPRFAPMFGLHLPPGGMIPQASPRDHAPGPRHWVNTWSTQDSTGSTGSGDTYRPL